ncbi:hypothetical protein BH09BAC1_BH09BAC1_25640 [soil metagenome]
MKRILVLALLLVVAVIAHSQGIQLRFDLIKEFSERPLLVAVPDPELKKLVEQYMASKWPFPNQQVEYIIQEKAAFFAERSISDGLPTHSYLLIAQTDKLITDNGQTTVKGKFYQIKAFLGRKGAGTSVFATVFYNPITSLELDYAFTLFNKLGLMAKGQAPYNIAEDVATLKKKTLLVPKGMLDPKLDMAAVKASYGADIKEVEISEILEAVNKRNADYAFLYMASMPFSGHPLGIVIDAANMQTLSVVSIGGMKVGFHFYQPNGDKVKHLWTVGDGKMGTKHLQHFLNVDSQTANRGFKLN